MVVTAVMMCGCSTTPTSSRACCRPAEVDQLVNNDFEGYYSEYAASHFAVQVWVNNAWVSALCLALGILGLPVVYLLFHNIANLAIIGSIMTGTTAAEHFWGLLLPHGLLELTAVFVAGGVGLQAVLVVGRARRPLPGASRSPARAGPPGPSRSAWSPSCWSAASSRRFVTPSGLPTGARVGIGILAELASSPTCSSSAGAAYHRGATGDIDASLLEDRVASAGLRYSRAVWSPGRLGDDQTAGTTLPEEP